jgi:hypothetical protein
LSVSSLSRKWSISLILIPVLFLIGSINTQPRFSEAQQCPPGQIYEPFDNVCVPSGRKHPPETAPPDNGPPENAPPDNGPPENQTGNPIKNPIKHPTKNPTNFPPNRSKHSRAGQPIDSSLAKNTICLAADNKGGTLHSGSFSIKAVGNLDKLSQIKMFRIWPNPYTSSGSLVVSDNDNRFDCDQRLNDLTLSHVPFEEYKINAIDQASGEPLLGFNFTVNPHVPSPVINIVKRDFGAPLPIRLVPDQHLLIFANSVTDPAQVANELSTRYKIDILQTLGGGINAVLIRVHDDKTIEEIMKDPRVAYREQDKIGSISSFDGQVLPKGIDRVGGDLYSPPGAVSMANSVISRINGTDESSKNVNVDVAILDTGISFEHPDLNVYRNVSFVNYTTIGDDDQGHGSHVAGIVAAKNNSFGVVGLAPGARLWAVKVCDKEGSCKTSDEIKGVEYVKNHADEIDVANISVENYNSPALNLAIKQAVMKGVTFVVSAGNSFRNASNISPANSPFVITVSAIADSDGMCGGYGLGTEFGRDDTFANFSNFGKVVDISAPGVDILSTYNGTDYGIDSGTSMAAPHVTGIVALLKARYPDLSPAQVYDALKAAAPNPDIPCNKELGGYFVGDADSLPEPMLQIPQNMTRNNS